MSRKTNIINNVLQILLIFGSLIAVIFTCNYRYATDLISVAIYFIIGIIASGFIITALHEIAHLIAGRINEFAFSSMTIWFFNFIKVGDKIKFKFTLMRSEAGYTEMIPKHNKDLKKRYMKMTIAGPMASMACMLIGAIALIVKLPPTLIWLYCIWSAFLPIGAYFFFGSILPMSSYGARNDGAVYHGLRKMDDETKVMLNLLEIQSEMYNGKTPAEIDEKLYFDLPQLPEDSPTFIMLLNARYCYYLDKEDYENAKKVNSRLVSLEDYMPKYYMQAIKADQLYNLCTFDFDEEKADDIMYELEKYLNKYNSVANVRVKLAYLLYARREKENAMMFYEKALKEAQRVQIKGYGAYETKLLDKMRADFD